MRTYTVADQDITATQMSLLTQINKIKYGKAEHQDMNLTGGNKLFDRIYNSNEAAMIHDAMDLAKKGLITLTKAGAILRVSYTELGTATLSVSSTPITPGVRRTAVTNGTCAEQHIPATITDALTTLANTPLRVNQWMATKVLGIKGNWAISKEAFNRESKAALMGLLAWGEGDIYSDAYCDWRGRVYLQTGTFGSFTHGPSMRAMLESAPVAVAEGSKEWDYFLTIISKEYGVTEENYEKYLGLERHQIINAGTLQAMRAARAIQEIKETGQTGYMIEQDASCSGGQIIALLTGDTKMAKYTNLLPDSVKHDMYTLISSAPEVTAMLADKGIVAKRLIRSAAKPVVMLSFYGASADSIALNIWTEQMGEFTITDAWDANPGDAMPLGSINWLGKDWEPTELFELVAAMAGELNKQFPIFSKFAGAMQGWYAKRSNLAASKGDEFVNMEWVTANGHMISRYIEDGKKGGTMPNFVHSVDASIVHRVINECARRGITITTVHDAFFTTVDKALELRQVVAQCYAGVVTDTQDPTGKGIFNVDSSMLNTLKDSALVGEIAYA